METVRELLRVMAALRDPDTGCPWDLAQDLGTIVPHTIEEAYEVAEAVEVGHMGSLRDELGDLLLQVVFYAQIAKERGSFDFEQIVAGLTEKLVRRHPHVFADTVYADLQEQSEAWEQIKQRERAAVGHDRASVMDGVPVGLPALTRARKLQSRASRLGLDWPRLDEVLEKLGEEIEELRCAVRDQARTRAVAHELGDLLFSCANLARWLDLDPEQVLRETNRRFDRRVRHVERALQGQSGAVDTEALDLLWEAAKRTTAASEEEGGGHGSF